MDKLSTAPVYAIIPVYNRRETTISCIEQLLAQSLPPAHIIVCDGGSSDGTPAEIRARFAAAPVTVLETPSVAFWGRQWRLPLIICVGSEIMGIILHYL
ncbi:glycosyltransferase family 2 protein [Chelatococcus daeguensis]|uniref:glycosyltransferase family 2 protein n=1 Tax=Chelatococcus daeguensis TaxID=444444 RepID=UPI003D7C161A